MNNHWKGSSFEPSIIWTTPQQYDDEEILLTKSQSVANELCEKTHRLSSDNTYAISTCNNITSVNSAIAAAAFDCCDGIFTRSSSSCPCDENSGCCGGCPPAPRVIKLLAICIGSLSLLLRMDAAITGKSDNSTMASTTQGKLHSLASSKQD
jgi:hypothetical protein